MENHGEQIEVLDGLRALAIMLVLLFHSAVKSPLWMDAASLPPGLSNLFLIFQNGWSGVYLFFVLSGFLITSQLLAARLEIKETRGKEIKYYLKKRFWRIAPAYYAVLPVYAAVKMIGAGALSSPDPAQDYLLWGWRVAYHALFMQDYLGSHIVGVFWSLAIEAKFYLLAPFIALAMLRLRPRARFAALAALCLLPLALRIITLLYFLPPFNDSDTYFIHVRDRFHLTTDSLSGGMLCAFLWHDEKIRRALRRRKIANILFFSGTLFLAVLLSGRVLQFPEVTFFEMTALLTLVGAGFCMMLLGLLGGCAGSGLFRGRAPRHIARISYSLYLVHLLAQPLQVAAETKLRALGVPPAAAWAGGFAPFFLCAAAASHMLYVLVERPFIRLSRRKKPAG